MISIRSRSDAVERIDSAMISLCGIRVGRRPLFPASPPVPSAIREEHTKDNTEHEHQNDDQDGRRCRGRTHRTFIPFTDLHIAVAAEQISQSYQQRCLLPEFLGTITHEQSRQISHAVVCSSRGKRTHSCNLVSANNFPSNNSLLPSSFLGIRLRQKRVAVTKDDQRQA